jgi:hypothetical protein
MKRLLLIGKKLARLDSIDWARCLTPNITDYQGLLFDCREMTDFAGQDGLAAILTGYQAAGHPIFVILPDLKNETSMTRDLRFLPSPMSLRVSRAPGRTLNLCRDAGQPFRDYYSCLRGHDVVFEINSRQPGQPAPRGVPKIVDNLNRLVCATANGTTAHFFHPPHRSRESEAFRILVEYFGPDFAEPEPEPTPEWAASVVSAMPGIQRIEEQTAQVLRQIDDLEKDADVLNVKKREIEKWAELLWLDGIALQRRVRDALDFLGFQTEMREPTGHSEDLVASHGTDRFLIEVTGATGSIKIEKARELVQWILDSESPGQVRGMLIGNAFRTEPPQNRPPTANHKLFTNEVEGLAERFDFALLDVRELYRAVVAKLEGKEIDLARICQAMSGKGNVALVV